MRRQPVRKLRHSGRGARDVERHVDRRGLGSVNTCAGPRRVHESEVGVNVIFDQLLGAQPERVGLTLRLGRAAPSPGREPGAFLEQGGRGRHHGR